MDTKYRTSFRLTPDAINILNSLADSWQCSKSQVIEQLLREARPEEPGWFKKWLSLFGVVTDFRVYPDSQEVFINGIKAENVPDEFWTHIGGAEPGVPNRLVTNLSGLNWPGCKME